MRVPIPLGAAALVLAGCTGHIDDPAPSSGAEGPGSPVAGDAGPTTQGFDPGPLPLRRLTHLEYGNTVRDLFGLPSPLDSAPRESGDGDFSNSASTLTVPRLLASRYQQAAEELASAADLTALLPCDPSSADEACARLFVQDFGMRAYRRPLEPGEVDGLLSLFRVESAVSDAADGIRLVIEAMLQSPHFLYRLEVGPRHDEEPGLTSWETAARLSYFLWATMPDDVLFAAAEANELETPDQVEAQARRMLEDPRARDAVARFYEEWLAVSALDEAHKSPELGVAFDDTVREAMRTELRLYVDDVLWSSDGRLETLLTSTAGFVNEPLAALYGLDGITGPEHRRTELPADRAGVLTQLGFLAVHASPTQSNPILRGKFVRERMLCQELPDPPADIVQAIAEPDTETSTRERFEQHRTDPACAACHELMDPIGFGFERFDAVGRARASDGTGPVDDAGELFATDDVDGRFRGAVELAGRLAGSRQVHDCLVEQWMEFALGRPTPPEQGAVLDALGEGFSESGGDLVELLIAIVRSDSFLHRSGEE